MKKNITIRDIAEALHTTPSTVSRALAGSPRIGESMKEAVRAMAESMGYIPNARAVSLRTGKGTLIGVIVPSINRDFFSSIIDGIESVASEKGYNIIIGQSRDEVEREKALVDEMFRCRVDGLIVCLAYTTSNYDHFMPVWRCGLPLIFCDRSPKNLTTARVNIDDYQAACSSAEHLVQQGCRRIAFFGGAENVDVFFERKKGYLDVMNKYGLPVIPSLVHEDAITFEKGKAAARKVLSLKKSEYPDGLFACEDYTAIGALTVFRENGFRVPEDLCICGFGNEEIASYVPPGITSIDQSSFEQGYQASLLFFEAQKSSDPSKFTTTMTLPSRLVIRGSSMRHPL